MKTQIKQLLYGILATSCFGLSCTSLTLGPEEYQWPPKDGEPMVTLLGPVYETGSETQAPLFKALEQAMTTIVENQQTHLPEFYQQRIAGMNHQLFRPGYSNEEEWGSIKSLSSKAEDYDTERMAGILQTSENRKSGLEMAIRMQPTIDPQPASVTLEGYRFVLQPSGKGQAEWFTEEVRMKGREAGDAFRKALVWLLAKPFAQAQKSFVLENVKVPVWKDKNTAGVMTFADKQFTADAEPVRKETVEVCVQTRLCPEMNVKGDEFVLVSKIADAQTICRIFGRELIDKETLLRLSLTEEGSNLLDRENGSAWHSGRETGYFKERSDHQEFIQAETGVVWCKLAKQETSPKFVQGIYILSDGSKYEGEFKDGILNGQGTFTSSGGSKYVGKFRNGKRNGHGTFTSPDGSKYVGKFRKGKRNGQGIFTWSDGGKYEGEWKNGVFHGQGAVTLADGEKYVGDWKNNKKHGQGTYTFLDSSKYAGEFRGNKPWNITFYDKDGIIRWKMVNGKQVDDVYIKISLRNLLSTNNGVMKSCWGLNLLKSGRTSRIKLDKNKKVIGGYVFEILKKYENVTGIKIKFKMAKTFQNCLDKMRNGTSDVMTGLLEKDDRKTYMDYYYWSKENDDRSKQIVISKKSPFAKYSKELEESMNIMKN